MQIRKTFQFIRAKNINETALQPFQKKITVFSLMFTGTQSLLLFFPLFPHPPLVSFAKNAAYKEWSQPCRAPHRNSWLPRWCTSGADPPPGRGWCEADCGEQCWGGRMGEGEKRMDVLFEVAE